MKKVYMHAIIAIRERQKSGHSLQRVATSDQQYFTISEVAADWYK